MPLLRSDSGGAIAERVAFTESEGTFSAEEKISVRSQRYKFVYNIQTGEELLFDLREDPLERTNRIGEGHPTAERWRMLVHAFSIEKFGGLHLACRSPRPATVEGSIGFRDAVAKRAHPFFQEPGDSVELQNERSVGFRFELEDGFDALLVDGPSEESGASFEFTIDGEKVAAQGSVPISFAERPGADYWAMPPADESGDYTRAAVRVASGGAEGEVVCHVWGTPPHRKRTGRRAAGTGVPTPDPELRERLRELGYAE
jgi:hypothetical protein